MDLSNRNGTPVDPVPFVVVSLLAVTAAITWGPVYLLGLGADRTVAVSVSAALAVVSVPVSYYRLVWTANPTVREEVPAQVRFRKLFWAIVVGVVVVLALMVVQVTVGPDSAPLA